MIVIISLLIIIIIVFILAIYFSCHHLATSQDSSLQFQKDLSPPKNISLLNDNWWFIFKVNTAFGEMYPRLFYMF